MAWYLTPDPTPRPLAVRGRGVWIETADGRRILDGSSGAMTVSLGHAHPAIVRAMAEQAAELAFTYRFHFVNRPMEQLAERIAAHTTGDLRYSFFVSSGSEATEAALQLALLYWRLRGRPEKTQVVSRLPGYHGSTLGALSMSGNRRWRVPFEPLLHPFPAVPPPVCYRCPWGQPGRHACALQCADAVEEAILRRGPERVAAFIAEPVTGSSLGAVGSPPGYLERVREICDRYDVLLILDEVVTAFGRTGRWFAYQHGGALPDVLVFGKGVSSGYVPLAGIVVRERVWAAFRQAGEGFPYGHTFSCFPLGCAVGLAVIREIEEHGLVEEAERKGRWLRERLAELARRHPIIGEVRGQGLLVGLELVADPETRATFPPEWQVTERLVRCCFEEGLLVYTGRAQLGALYPDAVLLCPPLIISEAELEELCRRLEAGLTRLAGELDRLMADPSGRLPVREG